MRAQHRLERTLRAAIAHAEAHLAHTTSRSKVCCSCLRAASRGAARALVSAVRRAIHHDTMSRNRRRWRVMQPPTRKGAAHQSLQKRTWTKQRRGQIHPQTLTKSPVDKKRVSSYKRVSRYKRVKGRSQTVEKRISMHLHKPHATSQPSRFSHTQTQHRLSGYASCVHTTSIATNIAPYIYTCLSMTSARHQQRVSPYTRWFRIMQCRAFHEVSSDRMQ